MSDARSARRFPCGWLGQCRHRHRSASKGLGYRLAAFAAAVSLAQLSGSAQAPGSGGAVVGAGDHLRLPGMADLSGLLEPIRRRYDIPAMAGAIVHGRETVALGATGIRRVGAHEEVTIHDRFHMGSCTKSMTATLCARLVERKILSWDLTIADAFPELRQRMRPEYRDVTLEQLLTHRGGLPHDLAKHEFWRRLWGHRGTSTEARRLLAEQVLVLPPDAEAGKYVYSNAGFAIAGHMAEVATGEAWENLMQEEIFRPLDMHSAGFGAPGQPGQRTEPRGHSKDGKPQEPGPFGRGDNPVAIGPAGTVHCSIGDWAKYVAVHLRGAQGDSKLVSAETYKKLHTPAPGPPPTYAMGWNVTERDWADGSVLTHAGSNTLWFAVVWIAPDKDFAVLVACNKGGESAVEACDKAAWALIQDHLAHVKSGHR